MRFAAAAAACAILLGGCCQYYHDIDSVLLVRPPGGHRPSSESLASADGAQVGPARAFATYSDVKQRAVFSVVRPDYRYPWTRTGEKWGQTKEPTRFLSNCPEAPPDAMSAIALSASGKVSAGDKAELMGAASQGENVADIGLRTETTEVLKETNVYNCLGYQSGAFNKGIAQVLALHQLTSTLAFGAYEAISGYAKAAALATGWPQPAPPADQGNNSSTPKNGDGAPPNKKNKGGGSPGGSKPQGKGTRTASSDTTAQGAAYRGSPGASDAVRLIRVSDTSGSDAASQTPRAAPPKVSNPKGAKKTRKTAPPKGKATPEPAAAKPSTAGSPDPTGDAAKAIAAVFGEALESGFSRDVCASVLMGEMYGDIPPPRATTVSADPTRKAPRSVSAICRDYLQQTVTAVAEDNAIRAWVAGYLEKNLNSNLSAADVEKLVSLAEGYPASAGPNDGQGSSPPYQQFFAQILTQQQKRYLSPSK